MLKIMQRFCCNRYATGCTKYIWQLRRFTDAHPILIEPLNKIETKRNKITAESLLSTENRFSTLKRMQREMPGVWSLPKVKAENVKLSAVMIVLCTVKDRHEVSILYTRRSANLSRHSRQISFPGGIMDQSDADFADCALRETEEEIGLTRDRIDVWGPGSLIRPPRTAAIMPVVGVVQNLDLRELTINEKEVEDAFLVPVSCLIKPTSLHHTQFKSGYSAPTFIVGFHRIWGVTAYMTLNFLNCLLPHSSNMLKERVQYVKPYKNL